MYMQDYVVSPGSEGIGLPALRAIPISADNKHDESLITAQEFIKELTKNPYCQQPSSTVRLPELICEYDRKRFLIRTARNDRAVPKFVPLSLLLHLLYHSHYSILEEHPGGKSVFDSTRREYYWSHMANDVYTILRDCRESAQIRWSKSDNASASSSPQVAHWNLSKWTSWDHFQRNYVAPRSYWS